MPTIPMYLRNADNNETVFCTVRMNMEKREALRTFMQSPDGEKDIFFPHHVRMVRVGFGWYRLISDCDHNAVEGVRNAMAEIQRFSEGFQEKCNKPDLIYLRKLQELVELQNAGELPLPDCQPPYTTEELLAAPSLSKAERKLWKQMGFGPITGELRKWDSQPKKPKKRKSKKERLIAEIGILAYESALHHAQFIKTERTPVMY